MRNDDEVEWFFLTDGNNFLKLAQRCAVLTEIVTELVPDKNELNIILSIISTIQSRRESAERSRAVMPSSAARPKILSIREDTSLLFFSVLIISSAED